MAEIIKKLNLNKHPKDVVNNSLVDAINIMISKDGTTLQTECGIDVFDTINIFLNNYFYNLYNEKKWEISNYNKYNIIHCCPCNKELLLFVKILNKPNDLYIFRYNEDENLIKSINNTIKYNNGKLITTFTYNKDELIVAISEYDAKFKNVDINIPLKVINFGKFIGGVKKTVIINDVEFSYYELSILDDKYHPICPKVKIPNVTHNLIFGNSYKGWYYIFIRYKISNNNYTQWFNTNKVIYIDSFIESDIFNYNVSKDIINEVESRSDDNLAKYPYTLNKKIIHSNNTDYAQITPELKFNELDNNYDNYQISCIIITKEYTKSLKTEDISINDDTIVFNNNLFNEYTIQDILKSYNNYYNVKSIDSYNNRLYISNYEEKNIDFNINDFKNIKLYINAKKNISTLFPILNIKYKFTNKNIDEQLHIIYDNGIFKYPFYKFYIENYKSYEVERFEDKEITTDYILIKYYKDGDNTTTANYIKLNINDFYIITKDNNNWNYAYLLKSNNDRYPIDSIINLDSNYATLVKINVTNEDNEFDETIDNDVYILYDITKINLNIENFNYDFYNKYKQSINNIGILPNNYYNFYIHFVDEYGYITEGININNFEIILINDNDDKEIELSIKNNLLYLKSIFNPDNMFYVTLNFKFENLNNINYKGYFISYEKLEKSFKYIAYGTNTTYNISNDKFNFEDIIDFNFNKVDIYNAEYDSINDIIKIKNIIETAKVINKELYVADTFNNLLNSTNILLKLENHTLTDNRKPISKLLYILYNEDTDKIYNNKNKTLIPCSNINYNLNSNIEINTKNCFITKQHYINYSRKSYYNSALKVFQINGTNKIEDVPIDLINFYYWDDILHESVKLNNKPEIVFFPTNIPEESGYNAAFKTGVILEAKNTIDLFKATQTTVYDLYPKVYINYRDDIEYIYKFNKTIRRSNVIQDESDIIGWRNFESEQYTNIIENKGSINKIIGIGSIMLVHTEHSLFIFNDTNTIKATESNIQLGNVDIWDIKYKELLTSKLGYAGIKNHDHGIVGAFGYIFYDYDNNIFYRYDNNKIERIDNNIINYINNFKYFNDRDVHFTDDVENNRLIISIINNNSITKHNTTTLSYNYKISDFISKHNYTFYKGYSTKTNTYLIGNISNNYNNIYKFINETDENYLNKSYNYNDIVIINNDYNKMSKIDILCNLDYEDIKYLNAIKYKLKNRINYNDSELPIITKILNSGNIIRIYSEFCDTGNINIDKNCDNTNVNVELLNSSNYTNGNYNKFNDYLKPYFRLGNWHFNGFKDKITKYLDPNDTTTVNETSEIYGNWFVVSFIFNKNKIIEIESIDYKINKDIIN